MKNQVGTYDVSYDVWLLNNGTVYPRTSWTKLLYLHVILIKAISIGR